MSLRTFTFFPGVRPLEELWFGVCLISFAVVYPLFKLRDGWTFLPVELYVLGIVPVLVLLPSLEAYFVFGQPLVYGLLVQRSNALIFPWLLLLVTWKRGIVKSRDIEVVLLGLAWFTFAVYSVMRIFLHPQSFPDAPPGFVLAAGEENPVFAVPGYFMTFGVLYYALRGLREHKGKYYFYAFVLFIQAIGPSGRFLTVSFIVTIGYFLVRWRPIPEIISTLSKFAVVAVAGLALLYFVNPEVLAARAESFGQAIKVATGGGQGQDASSNARVVETDIARPYLRRHPYLGNGVLSAQWNGGNAGIIATYFFQDDIGFVGILFSYGVIGLALFALQYVFAIIAGSRTSWRLQDPMVDASKAFVLFSAIVSTTTGLFVFSFEVSSFFIVLLVLVSQQKRAEAPQQTYLGSPRLLAGQVAS